MSNIEAIRLIKSIINALTKYKGAYVARSITVKTLMMLNRHLQADRGWFSDKRPIIVCLCGSTRFSEAYQAANLRETLNGKIVLTIGCDMRSDGYLFATATDSELAKIKQDLDVLHFRKIDLADEVYILNVDGYVGHSTMREIAYAREHDKTIRWLEPDKAVPSNFVWRKASE